MQPSQQLFMYPDNTGEEMSKIRNSKSIFAMLLLVMSGITSLPCFADGGITLGSSRVVYTQGSEQTALAITNSYDKGSYLIQSWVTTADGKKSSDFIIAPPLFSLDPKAQHSLRIIYRNIIKLLPEDRESLYYLNVKAIPPEVTTEGDSDGGILQVAYQTNIKLFYRPKSLPAKMIAAPDSLRCKRVGKVITLDNPSPYFVTFVNIKVDNKLLRDTMVAPKSNASIADVGEAGTVTFQTLNDFGANTDVQQCQ